jgi:hypothetical protein
MDAINIENELEDLLDIIIAEFRKNDEKISLEELGEQLRREGILKNER